MRSIIFGMLLSITTCLFIQNAKLNAELKFVKQAQKTSPAEKAKIKAQNGFKKYYQPTLVRAQTPDPGCPKHLPYSSHWGCVVTPINR